MILEHVHFDCLNKVVLQKVKFKAPLRSDATMADEACFLHVVNGNSSLYSAESEVKVQSGDNVVMKCGTYVYDWKPNENDTPTEAIFIHFYPDVLKWVYENELPAFLEQNEVNSSLPIAKVEMDIIVDKYVHSLLFYFENPALVTDDLIKLKIKELMLLLAQSGNSKKVKQLLNTMFNSVDYQFKQVIESNLYNDLSLPDLAVLTGMSLSTFKRTFTQLFGQSPKKYINQKRMERAIKLLDQSDLRVSDIGYECGFNDVGYFTKCFKSHTGHNPSEYRALTLS